jgi:beta-phosphoglucomutase-like phosphatase (HAD superfamily)
MVESTAPMRAPAAVLWDMDGTLVDTEPYWIASEFELAERHGGEWTRQHALNIVGKDLLDAARYMLEHAGIDVSPEQIVEEMLDGVVERVKREVPWIPCGQSGFPARSSRCPIVGSWTRSSRSCIRKRSRR